MEEGLRVDFEDGFCFLFRNIWGRGRTDGLMVGGGDVGGGGDIGRAGGGERRRRRRKEVLARGGGSCYFGCLV